MSAYTEDKLDEVIRQVRQRTACIPRTTGWNFWTRKHHLMDIEGLDLTLGLEYFRETEDSLIHATGRVCLEAEVPTRVFNKLCQALGAKHMERPKNKDVKIDFQIHTAFGVFGFMLEYPDDDRRFFWTFSDDDSGTRALVRLASTMFFVFLAAGREHACGRRSLTRDVSSGIWLPE